jgi:class 3 adenylate cyclase
MAQQATNPGAVELGAKFERLSTSPGGIRDLVLLNGQINIGPILPTIQVPTLVLHHREDKLIPVEAGRSLAEQIPNAKFVDYAGEDHLFCSGDVKAMMGDIEEFVTGIRDRSSFNLERVLATVLFTDIVDSTNRVAEIGDHSWRHLLDEYDSTALRIVEKYRGNLIKTTGDGILATFDGPGRAVRCAIELEAAATQMGLPSRSGIHIGEIEIRNKDIGGIAVHATARIMALSQPCEVLVSRVVMDLVAGAGLKFIPRGAHELKGVPGRWDLFVADA